MGRTPLHEGLTPPKVVKKPKRNKRKGKLVVVESPAKAKTIGNYLGRNYTVRASVGHVRDLLKSQISVDVENNFLPKYRVPKEKREVVKEIKSLAKKAEEIFIATDPDREGEAIAWHLTEAAEMEPEITKRVVFNEVTKTAVVRAFQTPREINMDLVDAQQARRILDRLVGYNLSPILWRKVRGRLSAGRVQSVALRIVVDREREIENFVPEEYWTIVAELTPDSTTDIFKAKLTKIDGRDPVLDKDEIVKPILTDMETAKYHIKRVKHGERKRKPAAPFTKKSPCIQDEGARSPRSSRGNSTHLCNAYTEGNEGVPFPGPKSSIQVNLAEVYCIANG
jgi:DNA topoisomerase-1